MSRPTCGESGGINKAGQPCGTTAIDSESGLCLNHDPARADQLALARQLHDEKVATKVDKCQYGTCWKKPPPGHRYCSDEHRTKAKHLRQKAGPATEIATQALPRDARRGDTYDRLLAEALMEQVSTGAVSMSDAAARLDVSVAAVSRAVATWQIDQANEAAAENWLRPNLPELTVETVELWVEAFLAFREVHFRTSHDKPFVTTPYMRRWVYHIFYALATGGRRAILSPPRHGKTELLQHVCLFLIGYRPNIAIMWVSKNERLARRSVRSIMSHLESNESLIAAFCPPGTQFRPRRGKSTAPWSPAGGEFEVATRTITGITAPTMIALSRTSTVRNQTADLIVCDDLEDHKSTQNEEGRIATRHFFFTELESRKEDHTAWFVIGSRAHFDDLYHYLLMDPEWDVEVNQAHNLDCSLDPLDENIHVECMMWPEVRTYRWLMKKFRSADAQGHRDLAEMVYQNSVTAAGMRSFTPEITDRCRNPNRVLGPDGIPAGYPLIGGLDPSHTGYQAAFLWAYGLEVDQSGEANLHMAMIDLENRKGGGIGQVRETVAAWYERYKLRHWIIEENLFKHGIRDDDQLTEYCAARGILIEDYTTGGEKWDEKLGVTSLAPMFARRQIDLPFGDADSMSATQLYQSQLHRFSAESKTRGAKRVSDLVMASWFPLETIRFELAAASLKSESAHDAIYAGEDYQEDYEAWSL